VLVKVPELADKTDNSSAAKIKTVVIKLPHVRGAPAAAGEKDNCWCQRALGRIYGLINIKIEFQGIYDFIDCFLGFH
jgi:hypothetical protein